MFVNFWRWLGSWQIWCGPLEDDFIAGKTASVTPCKLLLTFHFSNYSYPNKLMLAQTCRNFSSINKMTQRV